MQAFEPCITLRPSGSSDEKVQRYSCMYTKGSGWHQVRCSLGSSRQDERLGFNTLDFKSMPSHCRASSALLEQDTMALNAVAVVCLPASAGCLSNETATRMRVKTHLCPSPDGGNTIFRTQLRALPCAPRDCIGQWLLREGDCCRFPTLWEIPKMRCWGYRGRGKHSWVRGQHCWVGL